MNPTRVAIVLALAALPVLTGCGGGTPAPGTGGTPEQSSNGLSGARYISRADAICTDALRETRRLGRHFLTAGANLDPLTRTTKELVEPGIRIREQQASRLRRLGPPPDPALESYLELFDPIDSLSRLRAQAGRAGDIERAHTLEQLTQSLGNEQMKAARAAGLRTCDADFIRVALGSSSPG